MEDVVFKMKRNELTDVLETKQGFLVMQVLEHYDEGEQPAKVFPPGWDEIAQSRF